MEILTTVYSLFTVALLGIVLMALLVARAITPLERQLVTSAALALAGVFFLTRPAAEPVVLWVGIVGCVWGAAMFVRVVRQWSRTATSRLAPLAALVLLPPAVFGAVLLAGILISMMEAPARLALRIAGV